MLAGFKLAALNWGAVGFGEWMLARRVFAVVMPLTICGLDIALPRYLAIAAAGLGRFSPDRLVSGALQFVAVSAGTLVSATVFSSADIARVVFGSEDQASLVAATASVVVGYTPQVLLYGYLRGESRFGAANLLYVITHGVVPLVILALKPRSPGAALVQNSIVVFVVCSALWVLVLWRGRIAVHRPAFAEGRVLAGYGASRMYVALCLLLLSALPSVLAAREFGIAEAGIVAFGLSLIGIAAAAASPIGVAMLTSASVSFASGVPRVQAEVRTVALSVVAVGALGTAASYLAVEPLAAWFLPGSVTPSQILLLSVCALGTGPAFVFSAMRVVVDARTEEPLNARNVSMAFVLFIGLFVGGSLAFERPGAILPVVGYVIAFVALAIATMFSATRPTLEQTP